MIFLSIPTYNGQICTHTSNAIEYCSKEHSIIKAMSQTSLLANGFNMAYCQALNYRKLHPEAGLDWFAMLHGDVVPEKFFLDTLVTIANDKGADLLSAVIPIKDDSGDTSTATCLKNGDDFNPVHRINMDYIVEALPQTFSIEDFTAPTHLFDTDGSFHIDGNPQDYELLVNTGCMIVRLDKPWSDQVHFEINDRICIDDRGMYFAQVVPEDWNFSRMVAHHGGKVMATSAIKLKHVGIKFY